MKRHTIALFGEAEKGQLRTPHHLETLPQVVHVLGHPPEDSEGLFFAIQAILYNRNVIFFRVESEGLSEKDYWAGCQYLKTAPPISALCMPGMSQEMILLEVDKICDIHKSILITSQKDLYDHLTSQSVRRVH
jgi:hypothetical protein